MLVKALSLNTFALCLVPAVVAIAIRLVVVLVTLTMDPMLLAGSSPYWTADTERYIVLAGSLLEGRFATPAGPELFRMPGYPLLLAPGVALGLPTAGGMALQTLCCALLSSLVSRLALTLGLESRAALYAGLLCAVEPTLLLWSLLLMPECLLALVVGAALLALAAWWRNGARAWLIAAVLLAATAAYVKPVAYGFPLVVAALASLAGRRHGFRPALVLVAGIALGGAALGAWHVRNWTAGGAAVFSTQIAQMNRACDFAVWRATNPGASEEEIECERNRLAIRDPEARTPMVVESSLGQRLSVHMRGMARVVTNPGVVTWGQLLGLESKSHSVSIRLVREGRRNYFLHALRTRPAMAALTVVLGFLTFAYWTLFLIGLRPTLAAAPLVGLAGLATVGYFLVASGGPWGQSRFRAPFVSAWCLFAGFAFTARSPEKGSANDRGHVRRGTQEQIDRVREDARDQQGNAALPSHEGVEVGVDQGDKQQKPGGS